MHIHNIVTQFYRPSIVVQLNGDQALVSNLALTLGTPAAPFDRFTSFYEAYNLQVTSAECAILLDLIYRFPSTRHRLLDTVYCRCRQSAIRTSNHMQPDVQSRTGALC